MVSGFFSFHDGCVTCDQGVTILGVCAVLMTMMDYATGGGASQALATALYDDE
jgi:hypothetical protein